MAAGRGKGAKAQRLARAEQVAQMRREQRARERRQQWLTWGSVVVAVAVIAGLTGFGILRDKASKNLDGCQELQGVGRPCDHSGEVRAGSTRRR